jgi:ParB-like chromosome segregation protein Spo0J
MKVKTFEPKRPATAVNMPPADADIHPAADIFPPLSDTEYADLHRDIELHGVLEPIWVDVKGQVLDGRHRLRAAHELGMTCQTFVYDGSDPIGFVISLNLHRRHLTESQRAMVAAKLTNLREGRPSQKTPPIGGVSTKAAAKALHVGTRSVERAKTVLKQGSPEIVRAVESGEMRVFPAAALATAAIEEPPQTTEESNIDPSEKIKAGEVEDPTRGRPSPSGTTKRAKKNRYQRPDHAARLVEDAVSKLQTIVGKLRAVPPASLHQQLEAARWSHDLAEVVTYLRTFLRGLRPPMASHSNTSSAREIAEGAATDPDTSCPTRAD